MFSQLFGNYLVEKKIISTEDYKAAIEQQLAVADKLMYSDKLRYYKSKNS